MDKIPYILMLEDTEPMAAMYKAFLADEPYAIKHVKTLRQAFDAIDEKLPDILLLDLVLPDGNGMELLSFINGHQLPISVIVVTAFGTMDQCITAIKKGAEDFIIKPFPATRLKVTVKNTLKNRTLSHAIDDLKNSFGRHSFGGLLGESLVMQGLFQSASTAAQYDAPVLITGEDGTGKTTLANAIHKASPRGSEHIVTFYCEGHSAKDMATQLFGQKSGLLSFDKKTVKGSVREADGSTLIIENIDCMPRNLQHKLIDVLRHNRYAHHNDDKKRDVDLRVITTSRLSPTRLAARLLPELFYRISIIQLNLPNLKDRDADCLMLTNHILARLCKEQTKDFKYLDSGVESVFLSYPWPGHVRELEQLLENIISFHADTCITTEVLPKEFDEYISKTPKIKPMAQLHKRSINDNVHALWTVEKQAIDSALSACDGNIIEAARLLEISPRSIFEKQKRWSN